MCFLSLSGSLEQNSRKVGGGEPFIAAAATPIGMVGRAEDGVAVGVAVAARLAAAVRVVSPVAAGTVAAAVRVAVGERV